MPCDPLLLLIQSLYSLSKLQFYLSLLLFLVITLDIEHRNTYHYNVLLGLVNIRSKGLTKHLYFPGAKVPLHVLRPASVLIYIHIHLHSWLGLMTTEPKGLMKNSSQGENLFLCNKFIRSCIIMCIDFVAVTCIIMYCRTDMH